VKLSDDDVGWSDSEHNGSTVVLLAAYVVDVDYILFSVNLEDLAVPVVVDATEDLNFIILADRHGTDVELIAKLIRQSRAHDLTAARRGSRKVGLAVLPARGADS